MRAARLVYGHGTTNARDEAAWLALDALGLPPDDAAPHLDRALSAVERRAVERHFARRIRTRLPAAYLTRSAWLGDFRFYVDERAIVPRSYIAELLRDGLHPWIAHPRSVRSALDLCTGSGCLAVLLAHMFPRAAVDATDVSASALAVARRNVRDYGLRDRIRLVRTDLAAALGGRRYDLVVANPPYVPARTMRRLPREYRHEPRIALAGGADGLDLVRRLLAVATDLLRPDGLLVVEVGHHRRRVERTFPGLPFIWAETSGGDDCVFLLTREAIATTMATATKAAKAAAKPATAARRPARRRRATRADGAPLRA